jgi:hypothetical protein
VTAYYNEFDPYAAQWLRNLIEEFGAERGVEWTEPNCKQQEAASAA